MLDLLKRQLDEQFTQIKTTLVERPPKGWIESIRNALGMTQHQLGRRIGISTQAVQKIEESEKAYTVGLKTLQKVAESLECRLFYVLVPNNSLQDTVEKQITKKATSIVENISHSMSLEDQKTSSKEIEAQILNVVEDIKKRKNISMIWDEN